MSTQRAGIRAALDEFADTLQAAGFRVYRPGPSWTFLGFAREVEGAWCSATVQGSDFGNTYGWHWHMCIVPSREDGASMYLDDVPAGSPLTVDTATAVTRLAASNSVIPRLKPNAGWPPHWTEETPRA